MSATDVCKTLRRVGTSVTTGDLERLNPEGVRLLLRALLFDGAGVPAWHALAACAGMDEGMFFPAEGADGRPGAYRAKRICAGCPVRRECLEDALAWEMPSTRVGVRGGLLASERQRLAAGQAVAA